MRLNGSRGAHRHAGGITRFYQLRRLGSRIQLYRAYLRDLNFVFFSNPICACSTLKLSLNLSVARKLEIPFAIEDRSLIHKRDANLLKTPKVVGYGRFLEMMKDEAVTKFCFVRSPEKRLASAYKKKLTRGENNFTRKVRQHLDLPAGVPVSKVLSLDDFAAFITRDPVLRDLDEHWRLQRKQIFHDLVPQMQIGMVETFDMDAAAIFERLFGSGDYVIQDAVVLNASNKSSHEGKKDEFSSDFKNAVASAYAEDFAMIDGLIAKRNLAG